MHMPFTSTLPRAILLTALCAAVTGCGGSSSESSGPGNTDGSGSGSNGGDATGIPGISGLSGLDNDANNQDLLLFSHSFQSGEDPDTGQQQYTSTLYAINPANPSTPTAFPLDTRESAQGDDMGRTHYAPLYEAVIDEDSRNVTDYRVSDVLFLHNRKAGAPTSEGFARVSTDPTTPAQDPVRISSENYLEAAVTGGNTLIRQNYADADQAGVVYGLTQNEHRVRMTYEPDEAPLQAMSRTAKHVVHMRESDSSGTQHYLVLATHDDIQCSGSFRLVSGRDSLGKISSIGVNSLLPGNQTVYNAAPLGGPLNDDSQYLILDTTSASCESEGGTLWRYSPTGSGSLSQVLNSEGDPLVLPTGIAGPMLPAERHITREEDTLYFGVTGMAQTAPQNLYRVEGDLWSLLSGNEENLGYATGFVTADEGRVAASVGNQVVSWAADGSDRQVLDSSDATWLAIRTEVHGSRDGWLFYNRVGNTGQDHAVAMKIDGSDSIEIPGGQWVGASITGEGTAISNMTELSEVFLWHGKHIAAVSASTPEAGAVLLGSLDTTPEEVTMYGLAPGPHRLIQVHTSADDSAVYYVNTRAQGSLRKALTAAGEQRPVTGF